MQSTITWHFQEIKSPVGCFSPLKLHKFTRANEPTHCACEQDMSIHPIQVERINLGQVTDTGSHDIESAY